MKKNIIFALLAVMIGLYSCSSSVNELSNDMTEFETSAGKISKASATSYPTTGTNGMLGFAKSASVSGGGGGSVVYVGSASELQAYVSDNTPRVVVIAGNIAPTSKTRVTFGSNKTIIGSYAYNKIHNIYLAATSSSGNVIFQNLTFSHDAGINGNDDIQLYLNYGRGYWIDHCTFSGHSYSASGSDLDKLLYVGVYADYITMSQCKFMNHKYGLILGYPSDGAQGTYDGYPRMSIFNNYFENVYVRAPGLFRYGHFHVKNNYINNFNLAFTISQNARIYSEGNYFGTGASNGGTLNDYGNGWFTDADSYPTPSGQSSPQTTFFPWNSYSGYVKQTAEYAKQFATSWAGAQTSSNRWVFGY